MRSSSLSSSSSARTCPMRGGGVGCGGTCGGAGAGVGAGVGVAVEGRVVAVAGG
ncbi:hypothetical protein ACFYNM_13960 [Streptomyces spororaveus]|uniref:hypothetical protein n=1 Tax=Streptomyces spororaveus TaxID=284039 RepID=UPI003698572B